MNGKVFRLLEPMLFIAFSIIPVLYFLEHKYIASLDGPQHLYTARLISDLLKGDDFISQFYRFNPLIVGNQNSLFILAVLMLIFPSWIAEKIFLIIYVIGLAWSFRYFVRSIKPDISWMYFLIFPFAYTSLFMLGYYNFSVAFIPTFLTLGYFIRNENRLNLNKTLIITTLSTLTYLTHAVVFAWLGLVIAILMIFDMIYPVMIRQFNFKSLAITIKKYSHVFIAVLPGIILWGLYFLKLNKIEETNHEIAYLPASKVLQDIYGLRILTGFHHKLESGPNTLMFWSIVMFIILSFIPFKKIFPRWVSLKTVRDKDWIKWTFVTLMLLLMVFLIPDQLATGNMTSRITILFFFGLIAWLSIQYYPKPIMLAGVTLILISMIWHREIVKNFYNSLDKEISEIQYAGNYIEPNSVIFPVNFSDNWVQPHFHCYLGADKPIIDLRNPQANGLMPLVWNHYDMPEMFLGESDKTPAEVRRARRNNHVPDKKIDYVIIWKAKRIDKVEGGVDFINKIQPYYEEIYRSENGNIILYKVRMEDPPI